MRWLVIYLLIIGSIKFTSAQYPDATMFWDFELIEYGGGPDNIDTIAGVDLQKGNANGAIAGGAAVNPPTTFRDPNYSEIGWIFEGDEVA